MAAITMIILGLLKAGDHVVCSQSTFGSTIKLFQDFAKYGVADQLRLADRRGGLEGRRAARNPSCSSPRAPPTR